MQCNKCEATSVKRKEQLEEKVGCEQKKKEEDLDLGDCIKGTNNQAV